MSDSNCAELHVRQPARDRDIIVSDGAVTFNLDEDRKFHAKGLSKDARHLDAAAIVQRLHEWLADDAPMALVKVDGTIPPGHPFGLPATRPNGKPYT